ncbi:MAG: (d)CMP kinase [Clostridia bacterium]|nr:(d)CMP kinase [Clostridia bacterium]
MSLVVAIDGPAGSGKGTVTKIIANKKNLQYIDTGAMYRCIALKMLEENVGLEDTEKIRNILNDIEIDLEGSNVFLNNRDVTKQIRTVEVSNFTSPVSAIGFVREKMVELQRALAKGKDVIMEGRDIGTIVFPNADVKIYLDAKPEERARRRVEQNEKNGIASNYEQILKDIIERDTRDMTRENSPLKKADDAILVDTTSLTIDEVIDKIINIIENKMKE